MTEHLGDLRSQPTTTRFDFNVILVTSISIKYSFGKHEYQTVTENENQNPLAPERFWAIYCFTGTFIISTPVSDLLLKSFLSQFSNLSNARHVYN